MSELGLDPVDSAPPAAPGHRTGMPWLFVFQLAWVAAFAWLLIRAAAPAPLQSTQPAPAGVLYTVRAEDVVAGHGPTLRSLSQRYLIDSAQLAATLAANSGNQESGCADPDAERQIGDVVTIVLSPRADDRCMDKVGESTFPALQQSLPIAAPANSEVNDESNGTIENGTE
jgi:hypothetical protein